MTIKGINQKQAQQSVKFEVAKRIRELLDVARKEYGADEWDGDEVENEVVELVTEDE